jgi:hypothetical protein
MPKAGYCCVKPWSGQSWATRRGPTRPPPVHAAETRLDGQDLGWDNGRGLADDVRIEVIRKRDLEHNVPRGFHDPHGIASVGEAKRQLLLDNPLSRSADDPVALVGLRGDTVIGKLVLLAGEVLVQGEPSPASWTSDLYVHPEHRASLLGVSLVMKMARLAPLSLACGISQAALPVFRNLKWVDLEMPRWIMLRRSGPLVRRYLGRGLGQEAAAKVADAALAAYALVPRAALALLGRGLAARRVEAMPAELDGRIAAPDADVVCHRSSAWIAWLLAQARAVDPRKRSELHLVEHASGAVAGYVLTKARFHATASAQGFEDLWLGSVSDWRVLRPDLVDDRALVLFGIEALLRHPVDAIEICTADASVGDVLRKLGCRRAGTLHLMFKAARGAPLSDPAYRAADRWRLRPVEGDIFFF